MPIDFPDAPNLGDTFTVNDKTWTWNGNTWELVATPAGKSGSVTTIADTAPSNPALGDEWFNSSTGRRYTYYDDYWIEVGASVAGETGPQGPQGDTGPQGPAGNDGALSPNYIINGAFDIWQRLESGQTSFTDANGYTADRWRVQRTSGDTGAIATQVTDTPENFFYAIKVQREQGNTSTNRITLNYRFEEAGYLLAGKPVTISFYAKKGADFSANSGVIAELSTTSEDWGDFPINSDGRMNGTSTDIANDQKTFTTITETWERYSFSFTADSAAKSAIMTFRFELPTGTAGADDSFYITGVQLEAGSVATSFKRNANSIAGELQACQRYYYRVTVPEGFSAFATGFNQTEGQSRGVIYFPVKMREAPTSVLTTGNASDYSIAVFPADNVICSSVPSLQSKSESHVHVRFIDSAGSLTGGNATALRSANNTNVYLAWDVEL